MCFAFQRILMHVPRHRGPHLTRLKPPEVMSMMWTGCECPGDCYCVVFRVSGLDMPDQGACRCWGWTASKNSNHGLWFVFGLFMVCLWFVLLFSSHFRIHHEHNFWDISKSRLTVPGSFFCLNHLLAPHKSCNVKKTDSGFEQRHLAHDPHDPNDVHCG